MSGTAFGAIILHVDPEAAVGGPLAIVQTGDKIVLDVPNRSLNLEVNEIEIERRRANWKPPSPREEDRGYRKLFLEHVLQAGEGADFDFMSKRPYSSKTP